MTDVPGPEGITDADLYELVHLADDMVAVERFIVEYIIPEQWEPAPTEPFFTLTAHGHASDNPEDTQTLVLAVPPQMALHLAKVILDSLEQLRKDTQ